MNHPNRTTRLAAGLAIAAVLGACQEASAPSPAAPEATPGIAGASGKGADKDPEEQQALTTIDDLAVLLDDVNAGLESRGVDYRAFMVETITDDPEEQGITVLWNDRGDKQLGFDFVPGDVRREWSSDPNEMTYAIDPVDKTTFNGVSGATTDPEIRDAMGTWDDTSCSELGLTEIPSPVDLGVIAFINGLGGSPFVVADIHHAGWQEIEFGGATIAATFTFGFIDDAGNFTDINNDGKLDAAFREVYYDAICQACDPVTFWNWEIDDGIDEQGLEIDIESIVLHEAGHGLSQAHFGAGILTESNGKLHLAPRAVMQAAYIGPQTFLLGSDNGGHCTIWDGWPQS